MGTLNGQIYLPDIDETDWGEEVNENFRRTAEMDFTEATEPDPFDDYTLVYSSSAAALRKMALGNLANPSKTWGFEDECTATGDGLTGVLAAANGAGSAVAAGTDSGGHPGIILLSTGTTTTGRAGLISASPTTAFRLANGRVRYSVIIRITTVSDGTETYTLRCGLGDSASGEPVDGVYFRYTHSVNSGEWEGVCRSNSVETARDTNVAVAAATWYRLEAEVNAAGTSVQFYIGAAGAAPTAAGAAVTTNIPTGAGREMGFMPIVAVKSAGSVSRDFEIDYFSIGGVLTTAR